MTLPDFAQLSADAALSDATYTEGDGPAAAAFAALGHKVIARREDPHHQAAITVDQAGQIYLNASGSRITGGSAADALGDVITDMDVSAIAPEGLVTSGLVTAGPFRRAFDIFQWAAPIIATSRVVLDGHSLGAWTVGFAGSFLPADQVVRVSCFARPKGATVDYWNAVAPELRAKIATVIYNSDLWAGYPWRAASAIDLGDHGQRDPGPDPAAPMTWCHLPGASILWLPGPRGGFQTLTEAQWRGGRNPMDHALTSRYRPALAALAA
jgi:hypothetical protein